jgi:hypothetical protein
MGRGVEVPLKPSQSLKMNALTLRADERIAFNGVTAAAEASGLRPHHIRKAIASGELRSHAVARRTVILRDDLVEFIRRRPEPKSSRAQYNEESPYAQ